MGLLDQQSYAGYANEGQRLAVEPMSFTPMDAARFVAEATPIIGDAMAAKEVYDELQKPNPNYAMVAALGGAALVGLVPGLGDAMASGIKKGARGLLDTAKRIEVDPNALGMSGGNVRLKPPTKEELDPYGFQKTRMDIPLSDVDVDFTPDPNLSPKKKLDLESLEGKVAVPLMGDRSSVGTVKGLLGNTFENPVEVGGGIDFMRSGANQLDNAIWASKKGIISRIDNNAAKLQEANNGADIVGISLGMSPDAVDFADFTSEVMAEMVKFAPIKKSDVIQYDKYMKAYDPNWVGLESPDLRSYLKIVKPDIRKAFIRGMDSRPMQDAGFPSPAMIRKSVTDPNQVNMGSGMAGLSVGKINPKSGLLYNNAKDLKKGSNIEGLAQVPHSTYDTQIKGEYLGGVETPVYQGEVFKNLWDSMSGKTTKSGMPLNNAHKTHALKTKMSGQLLTEEILQNIMNAQGLLR